MADTAHSEPVDSADEEYLEYRPMEPWPIAALILGLASVSAFIVHVLLLVPILGVFASGVALLRIAREPGKPGRLLALAGLSLSLFCIAGSVSRTMSTEAMLARQARPVAKRFLELLQAQHPEEALLLHLPPDYRRPVDSDLWVFFRNDIEARTELQKFVANPGVRMLLALGDKARVRFLYTRAADYDGRTGQADCWFAVTFTDTDGRKKTLIFTLLMERKPTQDADLSPWRVRDFAVGPKSS